MTPPNLRELAQQGNATALAALLNSQLQPQGITVQTALKDSCLHVWLESAEQVPDRHALVELLRNELTDLEIDSINRVKVHGRQAGEKEPAWSHDIALEVGAYSMLIVPQTQDKNPAPPTQSAEVNQSQKSPFNPQRLNKLSIAILTAVLLLAFLVYAGHKLFTGSIENLNNTNENQTSPATNP